MPDIEFETAGLLREAQRHFAEAVSYLRVVFDEIADTQSREKIAELIDSLEKFDTELEKIIGGK